MGREAAPVHIEAHWGRFRVQFAYTDLALASNHTAQTVVATV